MAKERDLTRGSVADDVWALAVPAGLSLLFITLYNVTDVFYAGLLSAEAQAGLGVGTQVFFAVTALGIGLRVGLAAVVGRKLGASGLDEASPSAAEGVGIAVAVTLGGVLLCLLGLPLLIELVTSDGAYRQAATSFVRVMGAAVPGFVLAPALSGILAAQGDTVSFARGQAAASAANVGLNPLFMFGIPGWVGGLGLDGIAAATVVSQTGVMLWLAAQTLRSRVLLGVPAAAYRPSRARTVELLEQAVPATLNLTIVVVGGLVVQFLLKEYGSDAVAAYGVGFRLEQLLLLPTIGATTALLPITAQNLGGGRPERIRQAFWLCAGASLAMMGVGIVVIWTAGPWLVGLLSASGQVQEGAIAFLRVQTVALPWFVVLFSTQNLLQGLQRPRWPVVVSAWRQGLGLLLFGLLMKAWLGSPAGVWWAIAASVTTGALASAALAAWLADREGLVLWPPQIPPASPRQARP